MTQSLKTLLESVVDYAGLFPPSKLDMQPMLESYARAERSGERWMLGRVICPASRLEELSKLGAAMMPGTYATSGYREQALALEPWKVSVVLDGGVGAGMEALQRFNEQHSKEDAGLAAADTVELKVDSVEAVEAALEGIPDDIYPFFEFPAGEDCRGYVASLAGESAGAKIRCGGVNEELIPSVDEVAHFIHACSSANVPFKATAGLHHPVRSEQPLTYEDQPPRAVMHGFLNVLLGAVLFRAGEIGARQLEGILAETDPEAFRFEESRASWQGHAVDLDQLAASRGSFVTGFGSCSFEEPVRDLRALGLL